MIRAVGKSWRNSASLIVLSKPTPTCISNGTGDSNYDILLQTRTVDASFSKGVVFPGGVSEEADSNEDWLHLLSSFGFNQSDFQALHHSGAPITPIFADNPIKRHIALRITAIRETFEELGLLICSSEQKKNRHDIWTNVKSDIDVKYWQKRVSENPSELFNLCKEHNCYPDIWSLHYWSNWLSPVTLKKRFDTAFFVAALEDKPSSIKPNSEVVNVEWASPLQTIEANRQGKLQLYPPQGYELIRFSKFKNIEKLIDFAKERSSKGHDVIFPVHLNAKDGVVGLLPGDYLYPVNVDPTEDLVLEENKTILELRGTDRVLHRFELYLDNKTFFVNQKHISKNHINMGNEITPINVKFSHIK